MGPSMNHPHWPLLANDLSQTSHAYGFYGSSYCCEKCDNRPYKNKDRHKCKKEINVCKLCTVFGNRFEHLSSTKNRIYCEKYNRSFYDQECLDNHKYLCDYVYKCIDCY